MWQSELVSCLAAVESIQGTDLRVSLLRSSEIFPGGFFFRAALSLFWLDVPGGRMHGGARGCSFDENLGYLALILSIRKDRHGNVWRDTSRVHDKCH